MISTLAITPMLRAALLALHTCEGPARRIRGGFNAGDTLITRRTANSLVHYGRAVYDNDAFPSELRLTSAGKRIAAELPDAPRAKVGTA